jgi:hypothetical protein
MTLTVLPKPGDRYRHRLFEHQPANLDYCAVEVIAVTRYGERTFITAVYRAHRQGRRDVFASSLEEFAATYPNRHSDTDEGDTDGD